MSSAVTSGQSSTGTPAERESDPPQRVGFKRHLRVEVTEDRQVYLFSERNLTVLAGPTVSAVARLLDGSRDLPALLAEAPAGLDSDQIAGVLSRLADMAILTLRTENPEDRTGDESTLAYWDGAGMDAAEAAARVATGTVEVRTVGDINADPDHAVATLRRAGLTVATGEDHETAGLSVVLCDDYLNPELAEIDAAHRKSGRPWLLAKPVGTIVWLGPVFEPDLPGCWHCLAEPLSRHRDAESCAQAALGRTGPVRCPAASLPPLLDTALNLVAVEATKWLAGYRNPNRHGVWTFDSLDMSSRHHVLRARPQCAACGDPGLLRAQAHRPVVLRAVGRTTSGSGGHRALSTEQVRERYRHLVSPITGIIKEIRRDERAPAFFNSFRSGANIAARARDFGALRATLRNTNGGKGTTALQAEVGALCEAVERYSGTFHGDEERIRGSLRSLGERAIHPNACQLFHERQYRTRGQWNAERSAFQYIGAPFEDTTVTDWTPVWSLTQQRHRLLPTGLLYYRAPAEPGGAQPLADSNGNAAGSSLEDAVLQGLLELVERDAVALWWYNRNRLPAVDLDAFADPWLDELRSVYAELDREVWVLDVTADLRVPTMVAVSRRTGYSTEDIMFGFGAHLDPRIALHRALTELNQLMPALLTPAPDYAGADRDARRWWRYATVINQPYLLPDPSRQPRTPVNYEFAPRHDIRGEIELIKNRVESRGMELLVLDQTRPDIGLPVVKVIVPGMRHFWARFAPGRLYDVPVELGRQPAPTRYEDLNPFPMFL